MPSTALTDACSSSSSSAEIRRPLIWGAGSTRRTRSVGDMTQLPLSNVSQHPSNSCGDIIAVFLGLALRKALSVPVSLAEWISVTYGHLGIEVWRAG